MQSVALLSYTFEVHQRFFSQLSKFFTFFSAGNCNFCPLLRYSFTNSTSTHFLRPPSGFYNSYTIYIDCLCDQRHESLVRMRATSPCERTFRWRTIYQSSLTWRWSTRGCGDGTSPKSAERWV